MSTSSWPDQVLSRAHQRNRRRFAESEAEGAEPDPICRQHVGGSACGARVRTGAVKAGSDCWTLHVPVGGLVYANSFHAIARAFDICREQRLGPSLAIYEPGFLRTTLAFWLAGRLPAGAMVKLYFSTEHGLLGAPFWAPSDGNGPRRVP
jgi:hypothetical protein